MSEARKRWWAEKKAWKEEWDALEKIQGKGKFKGITMVVAPETKNDTFKDVKRTYYDFGNGPAFMGLKPGLIASVWSGLKKLRQEALKRVRG